MLQGILIKKVINLIAKQFKLDKILKYVEEPNELDKQVKSLQRSVNKYGKYIEEMEKDIADIKAVAHKPIDGLTDRLNKLEKKLKIFK
tara:strand:+ start:35 stop:298 length:264 start_codon:yes stop_codon:yes gene_type:complete